MYSHAHVSLGNKYAALLWTQGHGAAAASLTSISLWDSAAPKHLTAIFQSDRRLHNFPDLEEHFK